jgi:predicted ABC-type ATPase
VFAGPNGAGKTTLYRVVASSVARVNGDDLRHQGLSEAVVEEQLRAQLTQLVQDAESFVLESNLATTQDYERLRGLQKQGYRLVLLFVCLESAELCRQRVAIRVRQGGHPVDDATINHRYGRGLSLLKVNYQLFEAITLFDNSQGEVMAVLYVTNGTSLPGVGSLPAWAQGIHTHISRRAQLYQRLPALFTGELGDDLLNAGVREPDLT